MMSRVKARKVGRPSPRSERSAGRGRGDDAIASLSLLPSHLQNPYLTQDHDPLSTTSHLITMTILSDDTIPSSYPHPLPHNRKANKSHSASQPNNPHT